jgi:hypothetical protein
MARVLLLGAGASFGSNTSGVPPLGAHLYDALCAFNPPGWGAVPAEFAARFRADFESAMRELGDAHPHSVPPLQRAMAAYFFSFLPASNSLYFELAWRIRAARWPGAICTLNYERLLELSLSAHALRPVIGTSTTPGSTLELCLPHGCCHIFCDGVRGNAGGVSFSGFGITTDGPVVVVSNPQEHQQRISQDAIPPVMSYFEPSKRTTAGASFIAMQRTRWRELAAQADKIVAIGIRVRANDDHIWGPIAQSRAAVVYCSGAAAGEEFRGWASQTRSQAQNSVFAGYFADEFSSICRELGV